MTFIWKNVYAKYLMIFILLFIGWYIFFHNKNRVIEGFTWSKETIHDFLEYQNTMNANNYKFDMKVLQDQVPESEVKEFLKTGLWPWSNSTKYLYMDAIAKSPLIKMDPTIGLNYGMKLYNETAAKRLLSWNTKEGKFLLHGGLLGNSLNMPPDVQNIIRCSPEAHKSVMQKTVYTGFNDWNGYKNSITLDIPNEEIPLEMPGFQFVKEACNPCVALQSNDYSCPFRLRVKGDTEVSEIWQDLWGLN
jgi:hypothetical protein